MGKRGSGARAYTLVEILTVTAMIGILAALAIVGYRRWIQHARIADEKHFVGAITTGLQNYYNETQGYPNCSASLTSWYPTGPSSRKRYFHLSTHADYPCWRLLNVDTGAPLYLAFSLRAGTATEAIPQPLLKQALTIPAVTKPWYLLHAASDLDEDKELGYYVAFSLQPGQILIENEGE